MEKRPGIDEYFMSMARLVSSRATCMRRAVGAVIVKDKKLLATGYNGAPRGMKHCEEVGCLRERMGVPSGQRHELCRGVHAEQNAIIQAALFGVSIRGAKMYVTNYPCSVCAKMIVNAGIEELFFGAGYPDELAIQVLTEGKVRTVLFGKGGPKKMPRQGARAKPGKKPR